MEAKNINESNLEISDKVAQVMRKQWIGYQALLFSFPHEVCHIIYAFLYLKREKESLGARHVMCACIKNYVYNYSEMRGCFPVERRGSVSSNDDVNLVHDVPSFCSTTQFIALSELQGVEGETDERKHSRGFISIHARADN